MEDATSSSNIEAPTSSSGSGSSMREMPQFTSTLQQTSTTETLTTESEGYRSGGSDDWNSDGHGSGYNSDDTAGANPKTIFTNVVPVDKLKNGWNVMSTMFGKGLAFTKEKATDVYNSDTVQSIKERTSEAAVRTSEAAVASYEYGKERAGPVLEVTKEKARGAWASTKEGVSAAKAKAAPIVKDIRTSVHNFTGMPIRPDGDDSAETSEYEGLSPLSMSPPSSSPVSFSPPLSPKSSRAESPVNGLNLMDDPPPAPGTRQPVQPVPAAAALVQPQPIPLAEQPGSPPAVDLLN